MFVALGSNLGDRAETIRSALRELGAHREVRVVRCSQLHESEAVGGPPGQGRYLNAAAELWTSLSPRALLEWLLEIERRHGRTRSVPNAPRTLDLDLLLFGEQEIDEPGLTLPHPRMWEREFVMVPLREVCPEERLEAMRAR